MSHVDHTHTLASQAWREACARLEDYLESCDIRDPERRWRLSLEILDEARSKAAANTKLTPLEATMETVMSRTDEWFDFVANGEGASRGRVAWTSSGASAKFAKYFLEPEPPHELVAELRNETIQAKPELEFTSLVRMDVDYGPMEDIARETWEKFSWSFVLKAFLLWVVIFFVAWGTWLHFHP
ncbi:MAG TPA: hypothetical protein VIT91_16235 [Chthoniobacterales bacterium]